MTPDEAAYHLFHDEENLSVTLVRDDKFSVIFHVIPPSRNPAYNQLIAKLRARGCDVGPRDEKFVEVRYDFPLHIQRLR